MFDGINNLGLFVAAGIVLNLTPGPDVLYILTHSLKSGWRAGAVAALGITAGCFVHIAAAALGVSAVLAASSTAFSVLKWLGAAYLIYVGWTMLGIGRGSSHESLSTVKVIENATDSIADEETYPRNQGKSDLRTVFRNGFWTNALNPKVALFFLAFLPQFIAQGAQHKTLAFLMLGLVFNFNAMWVDLAYAALGAAVSRHFVGLRLAMRWLERVAGGLFIGFGLKLALADNAPG